MQIPNEIVTTTRKTVSNYIGGHWELSGSDEFLNVVNPATGEHLGRVPVGKASDVDRAVEAAAAAFPEWRRTPPEDRIQYLFRLKGLLEEHLEEIARICTMENGKTLAESKAELRRAIENVEVACGIPVLMQGYNLEDVARGNVDIVVGTHRLLQSDVGFPRLGLLIIDEEHRFGVADKERIKRLKKLEGLGLAREVETGRWTLSAGMDRTLKDLGERGDIIKTMHRALTREGLAEARPISAYVLHGEKTTEPIVGQVLDKGLGGDEMGERVRLVIDGVDGRVHHIEMDAARAEEVGRGMIVAAGSAPSGPRAADRTILDLDDYAGG